MGTYVKLLDGDWRIPETVEVLAKLKEMPTKLRGLKRGGSSRGESWFSWINDSVILNAKSVKEIFEYLGFEVDTSDPAYVSLLDYDNKTGQEDIFLAVVAPSVAEGSYLNWKVEDDSLYRYSVENKAMYVGDENPLSFRSELFRPVVYESHTDRDGKFHFEVITFDSIEDPAIRKHLNSYDRDKMERLEAESKVMADAERIIDEALSEVKEPNVEEATQVEDSQMAESLPID